MPVRGAAFSLLAAAGLLVVTAVPWMGQPPRRTDGQATRPTVSTAIVVGPTSVPGTPAPMIAPPPLVETNAESAVALGRPATEAAHRAAFDCRRPGTVVFYSPHADDETLSMGELIAQYAACGWKVEVVLVTDGSTSAARYTIDRFLALLHLPQLTTPAFVAARDREFLAALGRLGVPAGHVHFAGWVGGSLTVAEAGSTIARYSSEFPGALHVTMSQWDVNPDHRALGTALARLATTRHLQARWVVFHRYWASATFRSSCSSVDEPALLPAIRGAAAAYGLWDPFGGWYAIGVISVAHDFQVLRGDPRNLVCTTPGPVMTRIPGTTLPVLTDRIALTAGTSSALQ